MVEFEIYISESKEFITIPSSEVSSQNPLLMSSWAKDNSDDPEIMNSLF